MTLQPHQQRVIDEKGALDKNLSKLTSFIGSPTYYGLDTAERDRLVRQRLAMLDYSNILGERVAAFGS